LIEAIHVQLRKLEPQRQSVLRALRDVEQALQQARQVF
jgi:hypothetical protein